MLRTIIFITSLVISSAVAHAATVTERYDLMSYAPGGHSLYINGNKYHFGAGAEFVRYDNDTGALTGTALNGLDGYEVSLNFANFRDWTAQSGDGLDGKGAGNGDKTTWTYMDMVDVSTLTGVGALAGNDYDLIMKPIDGPYTFQYGVGANDKNGALGLSGWFYTKDDNGPCGGNSTCDFNLKMTPVPVPAGMALLPFGLGMLVALRRRRKAAA